MWGPRECPRYKIPLSQHGPPLPSSSFSGATALLNSFNMHQVCTTSSFNRVKYFQAFRLQKSRRVHRVFVRTFKFFKEKDYWANNPVIEGFGSYLPSLPKQKDAHYGEDHIDIHIYDIDNKSTALQRMMMLDNCLDMPEQLAIKTRDAITVLIYRLTMLETTHPPRLLLLDRSLVTRELTRSMVQSKASRHPPGVDSQLY